MRLLLLALLLAFPASARATGGSVTGDWMSGLDYRGWDGKGRLDLGEKEDWGLTGTFGYAHSFNGTESVSHQIVLGFDHEANDNWSFRGSVTGWRDQISQVKYFGPSWGFTYTAMEERRKKLKWGGDEEPKTVESWGFSFDNDLFFYQTGVNGSSETVKINGKKKVVPPTNGVTRLAQWHPTFTFEKALWAERITPSVTFGHYFYTRSPGVIEQQSGQLRLGASAGSLNSMASGFFKNNVSGALDVKLPYRAVFHAGLGAEQSAIDNSWTTTQELSVKQTYADLVRIRLVWDRSIEGGQDSDLYTAGASILF